MITYSTRQVAAKLGLTDVALGHYIKVGKIPPPNIVRIGARNVHAWTEEDVERVRKLLPKIANGRKTRYSKLKEKQKPPAGAPVPHKPRKTKKK
jgi:predicted DNA-binding transcriptional regulator AlpA